MEMKRIEVTQRIDDPNSQSSELKQVVLDFIIRWNTTYIMLSRFLPMSSIITDITLSPSVEIGLTKEQYEKLRRLSFTRFDWICLTALKEVLYPFYRATKILSGSQYPTLSITYPVVKGLKNFLSTTKDGEAIENILKHHLMHNFKHYFEDEMTLGQNRATLVCIVSSCFKHCYGYIIFRFLKIHSFKVSVRFWAEHRCKSTIDVIGFHSGKWTCMNWSEWGLVWWLIRVINVIRIKDMNTLNKLKQRRQASGQYDASSERHAVFAHISRKGLFGSSNVLNFDIYNEKWN